MTARQIFVKALSVAVGYCEAGTVEHGGNNLGDQVEFFQSLLGGSPGDPWCADFACTCLVKSYAFLNGLPADRAHLKTYIIPTQRSIGILLSGYCPSLQKSAVDHFLFRSRSFTPSVGDLVLFDFKGQGEPHHIGFVENYEGGVLHTVEGNTGNANPADGDGVYRKVRPLTHVFGYIHP